MPNIKLAYGHYTDVATGYGLATVGQSPLGCCGAVSLMSLTDNIKLKPRIDEVLDHFEGAYRKYRAFIAIPLKSIYEQTNPNPDDEDDDRNDPYAEDFAAVWQDILLKRGWVQSDTWVNPNTDRVLALFHKDL